MNDKNPVKLLGAGGGALYGAEGFTHHATEDVGLMKLLPNMKIVCPGNYEEMDGLFDDIMASDSPIYVRFGRKCDDLIYPESKNTKFKLGKPNIVCEGKDVVIMTYGTMLPECYKAVKLLNKDKIYPTLVSVHSFPFGDNINKIISHNNHFMYSHIIVVEDHQRTGGLYSSIMDNIDPEFYTTINHISFPNKFIDDVGSADYLYDKYGLTAEKIAKAIKKEVK